MCFRYEPPNSHNFIEYGNLETTFAILESKYELPMNPIRSGGLPVHLRLVLFSGGFTFVQM